MPLFSSRQPSSVSLAPTSLASSASSAPSTLSQSPSVPSRISEEAADDKAQHQPQPAVADVPATAPPTAAPAVLVPLSRAAASSSQRLELMQSANSSMVEASRRGSINVLKACLEYGCSPNLQCTSYGWTPLMHAAREGWLACVKMLLAFGADANLRDRMGQTALHRASFRGHYEIVRELLHHGADPTIEDFMTQTPQHLAVQEAHWKIQRKLDRAEQRWNHNQHKEGKLDAKALQKKNAKLAQRRQYLQVERREVQKLEQRTLALRRKEGVLDAVAAAATSESMPSTTSGKPLPARPALVIPPRPFVTVPLPGDSPLMHSAHSGSSLVLASA